MIRGPVSTHFVWCCSIVLLLCSGCAPAPSRQRVQEADIFIPTRDRDAVHFAQEGMALLKSSRFIDAEVRFRKALWLEPRARNVQAGLGTVLALQGQFDEAKAIFARLQQESPDSLEVLTGLAYVLFLAGEYEDSATVYETALSRAVEKEDPSAPVIARSLAALYFRIGDEGMARCASVQAMVLKPDISETLAHVKLLTAIGDFASADTLLTAFATANRLEMDARVQARLAMVYFGLGKVDEAKTMTNSALEAPTLPIEDRLGMEILAETLKDGSEEVQDSDEEVDEEKTPAALAARVQSGTALTWPPGLLDAMDSFKAVKES